MTGSCASDAPAAEALSAVLAAYRADAGILLEPGLGSRVFRVSASAGPLVRQETAPISATSLLPKWLRANRACLPIPDAIGVWSRLPPAEQTFLDALGVTVAVPLLDDQGLVAWAGLAAHDPVTSRPVPRPDVVAQRLRAARKDAADRERAALTARAQRLSLAGQLAAGIAHEIRNPLAAVRSMVQLMQHDTRAAPSPEVLAAMLRELDLMRDRLSGMVTLGQPRPQRDAPVDLHVVAQEAMTFCRPYARQRDQHLEVAGHGPLPVLGDAHELRHVVINVLINACQASPPGQAVRIETRALRQTALLTVTDSGTGMPPETLARIFEPFFTTKADGGGLGLAVSLAAVRRHDGDLAVTSDPGAGTVVTISLPLTAWPGPDGTHSGR